MNKPLIDKSIQRNPNKKYYYYRYKNFNISNVFYRLDDPEQPTEIVRMVARLTVSKLQYSNDDGGSVKHNIETGLLIPCSREEIWNIITKKATH